MPIFRDKEDQQGTFGPSMAAAMGMHRAKSDDEKAEKEPKEKSKDEHLKKAKHHLDKALEGKEGKEDEGMEHAEEESDGGGLASLMGGEEEE